MSMRKGTYSTIAAVTPARRALGFLAGSAVLAAGLAACGGSDVTCGDNTQKQGSRCVGVAPSGDRDGGSSGGADSGAGGTSSGGTSSGGASSGGTSSGGAGGGSSGSGGGGAGGATQADAGDAGGQPSDAIDFAGVRAAAPANQTPLGSSPPAPDSVMVAWQPATYPGHPGARIHYEIYVSESAGTQSFGVPQEIAPPGATSFVVQGLSATKKYYFVVRAVADQGDARDTNTVELAAQPAFDDVAPTFDGVSAVEATGPRSVKVSWPAATDDHTPAEGIVYRVFWSAVNGDLELVGAVSLPGATEAIVTGLTSAETDFDFRVVAVDAAGNASVTTKELTGTTGKDTEPPVFAGCLSATDPSASGATVSWLPATDDTTPPEAIRYTVYAAEVPVTKDTDFSTLLKAGVFTGGTSGRIDGLLPATRYRLVCRASDAFGNEETNRVVQVVNTRTDGQPPTFGGITSATPGSTSVDLAWAEATDNESAASKIRYNVYASTTSGTQDYSKAPIATVTGFTGMTVPKEALTLVTGGKVSNTDLFFVVRATDEAGNLSTTLTEVATRTLVSFADDIQPILSARCAILPCHTQGPDGSNQPIQGQNLDPGAAYDNIVDVVAREGVALSEPNLKRVDSTCRYTDCTQQAIREVELPKSYLWRKITATQPINQSSMPPASAPSQLDPSEKDTITAWIVQGALKN